MVAAAISRAWGAFKWPLQVFGPASARTRLVALYALVTGPLLLLLVIGTYTDRERALHEAMAQAGNVARMGALQQDEIVQDAFNLLRLLSEVPAIHGRECHAVLQRIDESHPQMTNISFYRADGTAACNSRQEMPVANVSDREYFQRAMASPVGALVASEIVVSRVSDLPSLIVAAPLRDAEGKATGVLTSALNLRWLTFLAQRMSEVAGTQVEIIDVSSGNFLAGRSSRADAGLLKALRARPGGGVIEGTMGGVPHVIAFTPLLGSSSPTSLVVGFPRAEVLAASTLHLRLNLLAFAGAALVAMYLAWRAADRSMLQPIRRMIAATSAIGHAEGPVAVGSVPGAVQELQVLAYSFDAMAERLRKRDASIAAMGASLASSEEHHRLLAENASDVIARFDPTFICTYVSPACLDMVGYTQDELVGAAMSELAHEADRARVQDELVHPLLAGAATASVIYRIIRKDGRIVWVEMLGRRVPKDAGFVTVSRDVSANKALEAKLEAANQQLRIQVMQDPLTGIANRRRFDEMLGFEFRRAQRLGEPLSVLLADIDHFKSFNDTFGHQVGDTCLRAVALTMDKALRRPGDLAGRYGGEEFAVLLPGTDAEGAIEVAERLRAAVSAVRIDLHAPAAKRLTISIGCATALPGSGVSGPAVLVEVADVALYAAKGDGRDCVRAGLLASGRGSDVPDHGMEHAWPVPGLENLADLSSDTGAVDDFSIEGHRHLSCAGWPAARAGQPEQQR